MATHIHMIRGVLLWSMLATSHPLTWVNYWISIISNASIFVKESSRYIQCFI